MVEGLSEELLLRAHNGSRKNKVNRTTILSFHKGFKNAISIWKTININSENKLAIIRDFDNQPNAKKEHEALDSNNVRSFTTSSYTLETEILKTGDNFKSLKALFADELVWNDIDDEKALLEKWLGEKLTPMLTLCKAYSSGNLEKFELPSHIKEALDWLGD